MKRRDRRIANEIALKQERNDFADYTQNLAIEKLIQLGYTLTAYEVNDGRQSIDIDAVKDGMHVLIEVKGARLKKSGRRGYRYRCTISRKCCSDVLLFCCQIPRKIVEIYTLKENHVWFVIPIAELWPRRHVSIWSPNPLQTAGQWKNYCEAWGLLDSYEIF